MKRLKSLRINAASERPKSLLPPQVVAIDSNVTRKQDDVQKSAHNKSQRFQKGETFTGKIGEDSFEYVSTYEEVCGDYSFKSDQHLKYFHNLFDGKAVRFCRENISLKCTSYKNAKQVMEKQYINLNRPLRIRQYLQDLNIFEILERESCRVGSGFEKLCNTITKYAPQGPLSYCTEEGKLK